MHRQLMVLDRFYTFIYLLRSFMVENKAKIVLCCRIYFITHNYSIASHAKLNESGHFIAF